VNLNRADSCFSATTKLPEAEDTIVGFGSKRGFLLTAL
jgi:hypothetical protein